MEAGQQVRLHVRNLLETAEDYRETERDRENETVKYNKNHVSK